MFGNSSQEVFTAVAILRARLIVSSGSQMELSFVLGKGREAPMKVMTVPKLDSQTALLATLIETGYLSSSHSEYQKGFYVDRHHYCLAMVKFYNQASKFIANRVCEILEHTSVDE